MNTPNQSPSSFWRQFAPTGISYFALPVFEFFLDKPCHTVAVADGWNCHNLYSRHKEALFRSDVIQVAHEGAVERRWRRMLFRWEDTWAVYQEGRLRVYAPTTDQAAAKMTDLMKSYSPGDGTEAFPPPCRGPSTLEDAAV